MTAKPGIHDRRASLFCMSKKLITVYDPSVLIAEVEKHYEKRVKLGRCNQRVVRSAKLVPSSRFVEIESKDGITHSLERRRVRDALRARGETRADAIVRNANGTYRIPLFQGETFFVAILENGSRITGEDKDRLAKRAANIAIAQATRVVEVVAA